MCVLLLSQVFLPSRLWSHFEQYTQQKEQEPLSFWANGINWVVVFLLISDPMRLAPGGCCSTQWCHRTRLLMNLMWLGGGITLFQCRRRWLQVSWMYSWSLGGDAGPFLIGMIWMEPSATWANLASCLCLRQTLLAWIALLLLKSRCCKGRGGHPWAIYVTDFMSIWQCCQAEWCSAPGTTAEISPVAQRPPTQAGAAVGLGNPPEAARLYYWNKSGLNDSYHPMSSMSCSWLRPPAQAQARPNNSADQEVTGFFFCESSVMAE